MFTARKALMAFCAFLVCAGAWAQKPESLQGKIGKIDRETSAITVLAGGEEKVIPVGASTKVVFEWTIDLSDIKDGDPVRARGGVSDDKTSIEAWGVYVLQEKPSKTGIEGRRVIGIAKVADGDVTIEADGHSIKIVQGENFRAVRFENRTVEDIEEGDGVQVNLRPSGPASLVTVNMHDKPMRPPKKPAALEGAEK